jgi:hypothetical protein
MQRQIYVGPILVLLCQLIVSSRSVGAVPVGTANLQQGAGSISGTLFYDRDGDGTFDSDESTLWDGIKVSLRGAAVQPTPTDAQGMYRFTGLAEGSYDIIIVERPNFFEETNEMARKVELGPGETKNDVNFGFQAPIELLAPWPVGLEWMAGGLSKGGGFYYGQGTHNHRNNDFYALDFNAPDKPDADREVLVLAVADGVVREVGYQNPGYGRYVVIGHPYGYTTRYAHLLQEPLVHEGEFVAQGAPLGQVGGSGLDQSDECDLNPGEDHLHFAMYYQDGANTSVRPEPIEANIPIMDGMKITSTNYSVGYEQIENVRDPITLSPHRAIIEAYQQFGGRFGVFGLPVDFVRALYQDRTTELWVQKFHPYSEPEKPWSGLDSVILEHIDENEDIGYFVIGPIWDAYTEGGIGQAVQRWGPPVSHSYLWNAPGSEGYRSDFANGSIIWLRAGNEREFIEEKNAHWEAQFFENPNFEGPSKRRLDKFIDFSWTKASSPGPVKAPEGLSVIWKMEKPGLIQAYKLMVKFQGHVEIKVDGKSVLERESEDKEEDDETSELNLGPDEIEVRFLQKAGKPARIWVSVTSLFIPPVFAPEGPIKSSFIEAALNDDDYANYRVPPAPREAPRCFDAKWIGEPELPVLQPGRSFMIAFEVRNTGVASWQPGEVYLENTNGVLLGAERRQNLNVEIQPGADMQWTFQVTAPDTLGPHVTEWRLVYKGQRFGPQLAAVVIATPVGLPDLEQAIRELIERLKRQWQEFGWSLEQLINQVVEGVIELFRVVVQGLILLAVLILLALFGRRD